MRRRKQTAEAGRIYGGESAAQRLARQRRQFLDAGLELFGTVGYRATTVRMLCKQAGLIDRYFYKNFRDTEDLLAAVYSESLDGVQVQILAAIAPLMTSRDPIKISEAGLDAFFKAIENPRVARICWLEILGVSPRIDAVYTGRIRQFANLLQTMSRQILPSWPENDDETNYIAIALIGAISQSALYWLLSDYQAERKVLVSATTKLLRGTVNALTPSSAAQAEVAQ